MPLLERASEALAERLPEGAKAHASTIIVVAGASVGFYTLRKLTRKIYRTNPFKFGNTGALAPDAIKDGISSYDAFFAQSKGKGIEDNQVAGKAKSNTPEFVDKFYRRAGACVKGGGRVGAHGGRSPSEPARLSCAAFGRQPGSRVASALPVRRRRALAGLARWEGRCKFGSPSLPLVTRLGRPTAALHLAARPALSLGPGRWTGPGGAGGRRRRSLRVPKDFPPAFRPRLSPPTLFTGQPPA